MCDANDQDGLAISQAQQGFCLTNMSITSLVGCALGASTALRVCILAVL